MSNQPYSSSRGQPSPLRLVFSYPASFYHRAVSYSRLKFFICDVPLHCCYDGKGTLSDNLKSVISKVSLGRKKTEEKRCLKLIDRPYLLLLKSFSPANTLHLVFGMRVIELAFLSSFPLDFLNRPHYYPSPVAATFALPVAYRGGGMDCKRERSSPRQARSHRPRYHDQWR